MADSPKTEMPSCGKDLYHFPTAEKNQLLSVCCTVTPHHGKSGEWIVKCSLMRGKANMQRMQRD